MQALTVEAALTGKREHVYHAAMLDPHTAAELDLDQIWRLVDDLMDAHGDYIPEPLRSTTTTETRRTDMATVALEDVNKVYDNGFHAIHDLSIEIADSEFLVLVGPSGCGKSTALRMVAGLETITAGKLMIGDRVVNDVQPKDRDIAMVFQNYALYPHMTVADNIGFALKLARVPKDEIRDRVRKAAAVLELEPYLDRKPGQLSGGQRQRVAMGRAIVRQPSAFLMDEPLSNLDAKLRVQMRAEIARLQRDLGVTTVYVDA